MDDNSLLYAGWLNDLFLQQDDEIEIVGEKVAITIMKTGTIYIILWNEG